MKLAVISSGGSASSNIVIWLIRMSCRLLGTRQPQLFLAFGIDECPHRELGHRTRRLTCSKLGRAITIPIRRASPTVLGFRSSSSRWRRWWTVQEPCDARSGWSVVRVLVQTTFVIYIPLRERIGSPPRPSVAKSILLRRSRHTSLWRRSSRGSTKQHVLQASISRDRLFPARSRATEGAPKVRRPKSQVGPKLTSLRASADGLTTNDDQRPHRERLESVRRSYRLSRAEAGESAHAEDTYRFCRQLPLTS